MIKGLGIDLVDIKRIEKMIDKWGDRFLDKIYTPLEIDYCKGKGRSFEHFAARFAAKEATVKMLGGAQGLNWRDLEIKNNHAGKPELILTNKALEIAQNNGIKKIHVSLSHEREMAIAEVIGEGD